MTIVIDRFYVGGSILVDRWVDISTAPFIESITGAQDGQPLTITGSGFDASDNTVFAGIPGDEARTPLEIGVDTEGTTAIVTDPIDGGAFSFTQPTSFFVRNAAGIASNVVSATVAPQTGRLARLIDQENLGDASTRIECDPPLALGHELEWDDPSVEVFGNGSFKSPSGTFNVRRFDGETRSDWAAQSRTEITTTAAVPDVENMTQAAAQAAILAAGLVPSVVLRVVSATIAVGNVVTQFPPPETVVALGSVVELTLSDVATGALIPDLFGFLQAEAEAALAALGFASSISRIIDGNNTGRVLGQSIVSGIIQPLGTVIDLAVSSNLMPNLIGIHRATAESRIIAANLTLNDELNTAISRIFDIDYVMGQSPPADTVVNPDDEVTLTISIGLGWNPALFSRVVTERIKRSRVAR